MNMIEVRAITPADRLWVAGLLEEHWGSTRIVSRGKVHQGDELPGFIAMRNGARVGLVTYRIDGSACEIVTLNSLTEGVGVGSALINAVKKAAGDEKCRRLWLVTTNDNTPAQRFYHKCGFTVAAIHRNAIQHARTLKPEIPAVGLNGIPIQDEVELESPLTQLKNQ
jgi:ribosomal protein S18 acetylase RimI-like enzyme